MSRKEFFSVGELTMVGIAQKVGTHTVTVLARNAEGEVSHCAGADVPHDADGGFAVGCIFILLSAGTIYLNAGSSTSANFDLLGTAIGAGGITALELAAGAVTPAKMGVLTKVTENTDNDITILAADLLKGYLRKTGCTGAHNVATDSAANIQGAFNATAGSWFDWIFMNSSGQTETLTAGAGVTLYGTAAVPNGKSARVRFINTGAGTIDAVISLSA